MKLSKISKYMDVLKGYSRHALLLSSHAAIKRVALSGGKINEVGISRNWICNGDISPDVEDVRYFLSEVTLDYLNEYLAKAKMEDLPVQDIGEFTCVDYDVNSTTIFSEENDERFSVGAYGSTLEITLENDVVSSSNDIYEEITQGRFWYMYRVFKKWSPEAAEILKNGVCGCLIHVCGCHDTPDYSGDCEPCGETCQRFQDCVESVIDDAELILKTKFNDPLIDCRANLVGCYHKKETCSSVGCEEWSAPKCNVCETEEGDELCVKSLSFQSNGDIEHLDRLYFSGSSEARGSMEADFSCTDKKYFLSVEGDRNLVFSVHATIEVKRCIC